MATLAKIQDYLRAEALKLGLHSRYVAAVDAIGTETGSDVRKELTGHETIACTAHEIRARRVEMMIEYALGQMVCNLLTNAVARAIAHEAGQIVSAEAHALSFDTSACERLAAEERARVKELLAE